MKTPTDYERYPLVMGIEFGAITSGISIAHKYRSSDIYTIRNRHVAKNELSKRISTSLLYKDGDLRDPKRITCDIDETITQIFENDIYIKNIKEIAYGYIRDKNIERRGLSIEKIVADYLRCIHDEAIKELKEFNFPKEHEKLFLDFKVEDIRYCVACPKNQERFLGQCFIGAGIIKDENELVYRLSYVTESEATAYDLLAWDRKNSGIKAPASFLICNLGHSDLGISEIKADTTDALSEVSLIQEYSGGGSMRLDNAFSSLIRKKTKSLSLDEDTTNTWMEKFAEEIKYGFGEINGEEVVNQLNIADQNGTSVQKLNDLDDIATQTILSENVFRPVVEEIIDNIFVSMKKGEDKNKGNTATYKKIFLTGKYSYESYFLEKLRLRGSSRNIDQKDIIPIDYNQRRYEASDSVSRGAVYCALRKKSAQIPFFDKEEEPPKRKKGKPIKMKKCDFIVGIDFGTTYSSISYSTPGGSSEIISIEKWSKHSPANAISKCPSVIIYDKNYTSPSKWGEEANNKRVGQNEQRLEYFKLSLSKESTLAYYKVQGEHEEKSKDEIEKLQEEFSAKGIAADKVIIDYIKKLTNYAKDYIYDTEEARSILSKVFSKRKLNIVYVLTVPAMWTEDAKSSMVKAALESKIIDDPEYLMIITEPEAAAISYESELTKVGEVSRKTFLVCDAGGGTVDLVTFRMEPDSTGGLMIRQLCEGDGDLCGSTLLDKNYEEFLRDFYTDPIHGLGLQENDIDYTDVLRIFRYETKPNFKYIKSDPGSIRIKLPGPSLKLWPDSRLTGDGRQFVDFGRDVLAEKIFDPVIKKVLDLLDVQMKRLKPDDQPDVILMVGGFSSSKYLFAEIKEHFRGRGIEVKNHPNPLTAISRGAVSYALKPRMISTKLISQSYAIEVKTRYEANDRLDHKIKESDVVGKQVIYSKSRLEYFIHCGENVRKNRLSVYQKRVYVEYPNNAIIAIFTSKVNPNNFNEEEKLKLRYVDPELHTKAIEVTVEMPIILPEPQTKEKIPFLITLEVDEITGVKVVIQCEKGNMQSYEVYPRLAGKAVVYVCDKGFTIEFNKKRGSKFGRFFSSAAGDK